MEKALEEEKSSGKEEEVKAKDSVVFTIFHPGYKSSLHISPEFKVSFTHPRPNLWRRFWYWALLGWRWKKVK